MTLNRARLLIVDDEPINIRLLDAMLRDDYDICAALSGNEAIKRVASTPPDLILLDIQMDDMDGYEVCKRLKACEYSQDIPVIFVTGKSDITEEIKGLELGAVDYITKPFHPQIVKIRLKNHLELKQQRDLLNRMSSMDGLTGIANRRYFDHFLTQEWSRTIRRDDEISLIMIDVDHFKKFNDFHGHIAGDDCLKSISKILSETLTRSTDLIARFGGEEFVCILSGTGLDGATSVAEKLKSSVMALNIEHPNSETNPMVTISLGVATAKPGVSDLQAIDLLQIADQQLYLAKHSGRNKVKSAQCPTPTLQNNAM